MYPIARQIRLETKARTNHKPRETRKSDVANPATPFWRISILANITFYMEKMNGKLGLASVLLSNGSSKVSLIEGLKF